MRVSLMREGAARGLLAAFVAKSREISRRHALHSVAAVAGSIAVLGLGSKASAGIEIVSFQASPAPGPTDQTFEYQPTIANPSMPSFQSGPGAIGNGDGTLSPGSQTPPGLLITTPFSLTAPGSIPDGSGTQFYDASLFLSGLTANAPAQQTTTPFGVFDSQNLGAGDFMIWSTTATPSSPLSTEVLLLSGHLDGAVIDGQDGGNAGATFSANDVTYNGGLIYNALISAGGNPNNNDFSVSMVNVIPDFGINGSGNLNNFTSDATGNLDAPVPEPVGLGLLGLGGLALLRRRRRA